MTNVLFDRQTLKVVGIGRDPQPFEVEIENVDPSALTKTIQVPVNVPKKDAAGKQLYLLPQDPLETDVQVTTAIESTNVTDKPVMIENVKKVPLLDADGKQIQYEVTTFDEETQEQAGTGVFLPCFTTETEQIQKTDADGNLLYFKDETTTEKQSTPQDPLEITADDPQYTDSLEEATETQETAQIITFSDRPGDFTYQDIVAAKEAQILAGTLKGTCILFEEMDAATFDKSAAGFKADLGFKFISLPAGGQARTIAIPLPGAVQNIKVVTEATQPLTISIGADPGSLQPLSSTGDVELSAAATTIYIQFENPNATRTDLHSFALLF